MFIKIKTPNIFDQKLFAQSTLITRGVSRPRGKCYFSARKPNRGNWLERVLRNEYILCTIYTDILSGRGTRSSETSDKKLLFAFTAKLHYTANLQ